jgi:UDP-2,4-diacetamido-2,4,6-trideoxy-beta-L-altropyranose hydrolase
MRCLAFAETLTWAGWSCAFATRRETLEAAPALRASGHAVKVIGTDAVDGLAPRLAVVDHYWLEADDERAIGSAQVVVFDDLADRPHDCAVLVDPTPGRAASDYAARVPPACRLLLGPSHAILRTAWGIARPEARSRLASPGPAGRILVSMGGTDAGNATERVLAALVASALPAQVDIILGAGAPHVERIRTVLRPGMTLHVQPQDLVALCAQADLAIGAPGTSSFERAVLGLPAILVPLADNQRFVAAAFADAGAADIVPAHLLDDPVALGERILALANDAPRRADMSRRTAALTDGRGRQRLLAAIAGDARTSAGRTVRLRLAEADDEAWLLALQTQEPTRRFALNPAIPSAQEHAAWFARVREDGNRLLAIVEVDGAPGGMVRLDRSADELASFEISIAIDSGRHGEGIGAAALSLVRRLAPAADLIATVKPENQPSLALFAAAGYRPEGNDRYRCHAA